MSNVHYGTNDQGDHGQQTHDKGARAVLPPEIEADPAKARPAKQKETGVED